MQRTASADTDDNSVDFVSADASPGAANPIDGGGGGGEPGPLRIHDIQGDTWLSPHAGEQVTNVPGIVTAVRLAGSSRGFWIQDPNPDTDPATSEGIFVFTGSARRSRSATRCSCRARSATSTRSHRATRWRPRRTCR